MKNSQYYILSSILQMQIKLGVFIKYSLFTIDFLHVQKRKTFAKYESFKVNSSLYIFRYILLFSS